MTTDVFYGLVPADGIRGQLVLDLLEKAIETQTPLVRKNIDRVRQRNPEAPPAQVIRILERTYVRALTGLGAVVAGIAAAPGVGKEVSRASSAGEALPSLEATVLFVLSIAEVHGVPIDEIEQSRTIVMGIMVGGTGPAAFAKIAEHTGRRWGHQAVDKVPAATLRRINKILGRRNFVTKYGSKQGIVVLSHVVPIGISIMIGGGANAALAALSVKASRRVFGPPPASWPASAHSTPPASEDSSADRGCEDDIRSVTWVP